MRGCPEIEINLVALVLVKICANILIAEVRKSCGKGKARGELDFCQSLNPLPSSSASGEKWRLPVSAGSIFFTKHSLSYFSFTVLSETIMNICHAEQASYRSQGKGPWQIVEQRGETYLHIPFALTAFREQVSRCEFRLIRITDLEWLWGDGKVSVPLPSFECSRCWSKDSLKSISKWVPAFISIPRCHKC